MTDSPATVFARYEPVSPPAVLLRTPPGPAEVPDHVVVRQDWRQAPDDPTKATPAGRHLVPPRTDVQMAEWHGALDDPTQPGSPMVASLYADLCARDAADAGRRCRGLPYDAVTGQMDHYYDTDNLPIPYLVDTMARRVPVRTSPPASAGTEWYATTQPAKWPDAPQPVLLTVTGGPAAGWAATRARPTSSTSAWRRATCTGCACRVRSNPRARSNPRQTFSTWP